MRLSIVTFHFADNYGAVLQAYALQTYLESLGHEVSIINYRPDYMTKGGCLRIPRSKKDLYANATVVFIKMARLRAALTGKKREAAFEAFRVEHLKIGRREYTSLAQLRTDPPACDAYVCGSDQIWNPPARTGVDAAYYLDFGPKTCRRISYAASFGRATVEEEYRRTIGRLLGQLDAVSVREESGVGLVQSLAGRSASWVPDPALLFDAYDPVLSAPPDDNYVFSYCLCGNDSISAVEKCVAKRLDSRIVSPYDSQRHWSSSGDVIQMGPSEWIGHIKHARAVVTNSFHGTIFSILFRKPFITVPLAGRKQDLNDRAKSLLTRLGLAERLLCESGETAAKSLIDTPVDWEDVYRRLELWRGEARSYLEAVLR